MKTIEVSDEVYEFLKECKKELNTQDNRSTRNPIYTIWHKVKEYGISDGYASEHIYLWDDSEYENLEEVFNSLLVDGYESDLLQAYSENNVEEKLILEIDEHTVPILKEWFTDKLNEYEVMEFMEELTGNNFSKVGIRWKHEQATNEGCFSFFEKDAEDHIKLNGHNIRGEKYTYADSLYRSPRMEKLMEILNTLEFKE
ncbi:MAG: hypothetical protein AB7V16_07210 [Vulcanibacillus sp.]